MQAAVKPASLLELAKTVLAGFVGIRRKSDHERTSLKPAHIVAAAAVFLALFIFTLLAIVRIVTR